MSAPAAPLRTAKAATHLWLTDEPAACELLADSPVAFIIGFILDQQVTVQKAFRGGFDLRERVGTLDAADLAAMPLDRLEAAFTEKPALHRFPKAMAKRVQDAMRIVVDRYDGDAGRLWWEARDLDDLKARLDELPGLGGHKWVSITAVLVRQCGVPITGWEQEIPVWGTLGDVTSPEDLKGYQARKRAYKKQLRETEAAASGAKAGSKAGAKAGT